MVPPAEEVSAMSSPQEIKTALDSAIADTAAQHSGDREFSRARKLSLETVLRLLIGAEGGSLARILRAAGVDATPAALSQRRGQISPDVFREVFDRFNTDCTDSATFRGRAVLACDGSAISIPRNPDAPSFVTHAGAPEGFNQLHLNPLYNVLDRVFTDAVVQFEPQKDEIGALIEMIKRNTFHSDAILLMDRGYESYGLIAHCLAKPNLDFVLRIKQNHSAMREVARLPMFELDCDIAFTISTTQTNEDKQNRHIHLQVPKNSKPGSKTRRARWDFPSPYPMRLRICRFQLDNGSFETIATSLDRSFTLQDIKELYHLRWGIETGFRDLKYSTGLINIHGKSDNYTIQEIWAALTAFNCTSRIAREVVVRQPPGSAYAYRVNFKNAVALCKEHIRAPGADWSDLVREISKNLVSVQPGRQDERNIRAKGFVGFLYRVAA